MAGRRAGTAVGKVQSDRRMLPSFFRPLQSTARTCVVAVKGGAANQGQAEHALASAGGALAARTGAWRRGARCRPCARRAVLLLLLVLLLEGGCGVEGRFQGHREPVERPVGCRRGRV